MVLALPDSSFSAFDSGDTAWILISSALVLLMTPGLAFFYGGLSRSRAVLNMMMMSFGALGVVSVIYVLWGYSMSFSSAHTGESDIWGIFSNPFSLWGLSQLLETRDITVDSQAHVFYANGIAVSNSHALEYAVISSVEFWLKFNFQTEYLAALINNASTSADPGQRSDMVRYVNYARNRNIGVLVPSVNKSGKNVRIENDKIRLALSHVKNVGKSADLIETNAP
ncbi:MAG: hypothetical protein LLG14_15000, partial [Nocardiaceae bacterium]|nr:hypothetical protein [Nocardiaceae bacterium]